MVPLSPLSVKLHVPFLNRWNLPSMSQKPMSLDDKALIEHHILNLLTLYRHEREMVLVKGLVSLPVNKQFCKISSSFN